MVEYTPLDGDNQQHIKRYYARYSLVKMRYRYYTLMMLAICSAPLQVRLHPVKSTVLMLVEYLTLWQMTEKHKNGS